MGKVKPGQRKIVLEHMELAGYPLVPSDENFDKASVPSTDPDYEECVSTRWPTIHARLVMPVGSGGKIVRADKLYDVHYGLLATAALTDYEENLVPYTAYGLIHQIQWTYGGRQVRLLRRCLNHLKGMRLEIDGEVQDPARPGHTYDGIQQHQVIISWGEPKSEDQVAGGRGRNMSWVKYNPDYLQSIARDRGVQIDVEMMSQINGSLPKALYRLLSWLRTRGEESIDLEEAFSRVGSSRKRITPSDAKRAFGQCFDVMLRYRHLKYEPKFERRPDGSYTMYLDWDDPIDLPHKGDALFQRLVGYGVEPRVAANMLHKDKIRAARVIQAYLHGALPEPTGTIARLLVGAFKDPAWELPSLTRDQQLELLENGYG